MRLQGQRLGGDLGELVQGGGGGTATVLGVAAGSDGIVSGGLGGFQPARGGYEVAL